MLYKNAFPFLFNLGKDRSGIREKLIKCNRLYLLCHRPSLLSHSIAQFVLRRKAALKKGGHSDFCVRLHGTRKGCHYYTTVHLRSIVVRGLAPLMSMQKLTSTP